MIEPRHPALCTGRMWRMLWARHDTNTYLMCLQKSSVCPWDSWNWAGDEIIHRPIIRASRQIPGRKRRYDIDIREFLTTKNNAVVGRALGELIAALPAESQAGFRSHATGSFDFRADRIKEFLGKLRYLPDANRSGRSPDAWLFPDETLAQGGGDCEDLALLMAALLLASGISSYCVRVALGSLQIKTPGERAQKHDHCWVMYENESGVWEIMEPLRLSAQGRTPAARGAKASAALSTEYIPHYVFNADHLWYVNSTQFRPSGDLNDYCRSRSFWSRFNPKFAASVHNTIFDQALRDPGTGALLIPQTGLSRIKRRSLWLDANLAAYNPCDHFDNGYIDEGWALIQQRLDSFQANNGDWESFGSAAHAIGDFYAHSSYLHFAPIPQGVAPCYEGAVLPNSPTYTGEPFSLVSGRFSVNPYVWKGDPAAGAAFWAGRFVSGRYAQKYDPRATFWEGFTSLPAKLPAAANFKYRGALPHHDEIAVDSVQCRQTHRLYSAVSSGPEDRLSYANQYQWRLSTAIAHIRQALLDHYHAG